MLTITMDTGEQYRFCANLTAYAALRSMIEMNKQRTYDIPTRRDCDCQFLLISHIVNVRYEEVTSC